MSSSIHFNSYSQWAAKSLRIFSLCLPGIMAFSQNLPLEPTKASGPEFRKSGYENKSRKKRDEQLRVARCGHSCPQ